VLLLTGISGTWLRAHIHMLCMVICLIPYGVAQLNQSPEGWAQRPGIQSQWEGHTKTRGGGHMNIFSFLLETMDSADYSGGGGVSTSKVALFGFVCETRFARFRSKQKSFSMSQVLFRLQKNWLFANSFVSQLPKNQFRCGFANLKQNKFCGQPFFWQQWETVKNCVQSTCMIRPKKFRHRLKGQTSQKSIYTATVSTKGYYNNNYSNLPFKPTIYNIFG
jgi:hypothetical protein